MDGEEEIEELPQYSKEVAKGSFWGLAGSVFYKIISFLYVILIARAASQDDVGIFYLALAIVTFLIVISDLGLPGSLLRYVPYFKGRGEEAKVRKLLRISYVAMAVSGIIFVALLWLSADYLGVLYQNPKLPDAIRMVSIFLLLNNVFKLNYSYMQGTSDIRSMQFALNLDNLLKLVLTVALFYLYGPSVLTISAAFVLSHLIAMLLSFRDPLAALRKSAGREEDVPLPALLKEIIPFGLMLSLVNSLYLIITSSDRVVLGYLTDPASAASIVGIYSIATTLATVLMIFPSSLGAIFLPVMSRLGAKENFAEMRSVMQTTQRWALFITMPVALVMVAFSAELLSLFYGKDYGSGAPALEIFTFGILVNSLSYLFSLALASLRLVGLELKIAAAGAIINLVLNLLLIPTWGMEGAALASFCSFAIMLLLLRYYGGKLFGFGFPQGMYKLLIAGIATLALLIVVKPFALSIQFPGFSLLGEFQAYASKVLYLFYLMLLTALSGCIFAFFALVLKCFHREDVLLMKKALQRAGMPPAVIALSEGIASWGVPAHGVAKQK